MSKMTSKYSFKKSSNRIFLHDNDTPTRHELLNENYTGRHGTSLWFIVNGGPRGLQNNADYCFCP